MPGSGRALCAAASQPRPAAAARRTHGPPGKLAGRARLRGVPCIASTSSLRAARRRRSAEALQDCSCKSYRGHPPPMGHPCSAAASTMISQSARRSDTIAGCSLSHRGQHHLPVSLQLRRGSTASLCCRRKRDVAPGSLQRISDAGQRCAPPPPFAHPGPHRLLRDCRWPPGRGLRAKLLLARRQQARR